jgi:hypothetical protein
MKTNFNRQFFILFVGAFLCSLGSVKANAVVDWNVIAGQASATATAAGRPNAFSVIDFAMVHVAIHDAVQAYEGRFKPYYSEIPDASGSPIAAISKAAHDVLVNRFPAQTESLDDIYSQYLADHDLNEDDPGVTVGENAAAGIITLRQNDGSFPPNPDPFLGGTDPGEWRPTFPAFAPGLMPWLGAVKTFAIDNTDFCHPGPPPALSSGTYTKDYNEVKELGSKTSTLRTDEQTDMANFWSESSILIWLRGLRPIAEANLNNLGDTARLFALNYLANADALICSWESKYSFVFWRPITAIREGDNDGNPQTVGDSGWLPLLVTPPYPDYTSGANNISGSTTRILQRFFDTNHMDFTLDSTFPATIDKERKFSKFSDAAAEVVEARILEGIHFRSADKVGRKQGRKIADYIFENFLIPID